ncbi:MAG: hypothetical protein A2X31_00015 [Elusimicrobia bacterium GWB2_63_22]|nr:MAG: hypothetical protein A2X31_00015 [Elusimicrobia bacterium GWB2_63_22]
MSKLENQTMLVTALRAFTGALPPGYTTEKEFFLTSLTNMEEYLGELQRETLAEACGSFLRRLDARRVGPAEIDAFKAAVDHLLSNEDFRLVSAGMAGSPDFIRQRLSGVRPVSLLRAAKKGGVLHPETARRLDAVYSRLNFPALVRQVEAAPNDLAANAALGRAREEVAEYCVLYRVQAGAADTLTPFSLATVDAALAASYLLFRNIGKATGRAL